MSLKIFEEIIVKGDKISKKHTSTPNNAKFLTLKHPYLYTEMASNSLLHEIQTSVNHHKKNVGCKTVLDKTKSHIS